MAPVTTNLAAKHGWTPELFLSELSSSGEDESSDEDDGLVVVPVSPIKVDPQQNQADSELVSTKKIIRSLVLPHAKKGMDAFHLNHDYKLLEGCPVPFKELGFNDLFTFLKSIGDTVICFKYKHDNGQERLMVRPVADASTSHIQKMVTGQRTRKRRKNGNKKKNLSNYKTPENRRSFPNQMSSGSNSNQRPIRYGFKAGNNQKRFKSGDEPVTASKYWNRHIPTNFNFTAPPTSSVKPVQFPDWNA